MISKISAVTAISKNAAFLWFVMPMHLNDMYRKKHVLRIASPALRESADAVVFKAVISGMLRSPLLRAANAVNAEDAANAADLPQISEESFLCLIIICLADRDLDLGFSLDAACGGEAG